MVSFEDGCSAKRKEKWKELIAKYLRALPEQVEIMAGALKSKDLPKVETEAHRIKGTAGTYGLLKIAKMASEVEVSAKSGKVEKTCKGIERLAGLVQVRISEL